MLFRSEISKDKNSRRNWRSPAEDLNFWIADYTDKYHASWI